LRQCFGGLTTWIAGTSPAMTKKESHPAYTRSISAAMPWPTPMHIVHSA
jgi:hypothetical protein